MQTDGCGAVSIVQQQPTCLRKSTQLLMSFLKINSSLQQVIRTQHTVAMDCRVMQYCINLSSQIRYLNFTYKRQRKDPTQHTCPQYIRAQSRFIKCKQHFPKPRCVCLMIDYASLRQPSCFISSSQVDAAFMHCISAHDAHSQFSIESAWSQRNTLIHPSTTEQAVIVQSCLMHLASAVGGLRWLVLLWLPNAVGPMQHRPVPDQAACKVVQISPNQPCANPTAHQLTSSSNSFFYLYKNCVLMPI
jgi:hypothetical protein